MTAAIAFIIGMMFGGIFGFCILSCFQLHRVQKYENEIRILKQQLNNK